MTLAHPVDMKAQISLTVNGIEHELWVRRDRTLLNVLHDDIGMPDVRYGCGEGVCGTCTVIMNGDLVSSCLTLAMAAQGAVIETVAGLRPDKSDPTATMHPLQEKFLAHGAAQCGFCTTGMLLTAKKLAEENPKATRQEIRQAISGNLCRCTGYTKILDAIEDYLGGNQPSAEGNN